MFYNCNTMPSHIHGDTDPFTYKSGPHKVASKNHATQTRTSMVLRYSTYLGTRGSKE
jgi:hypothetical protein